MQSERASCSTSLRKEGQGFRGLMGTFSEGQAQQMILHMMSSLSGMNIFIYVEGEGAMQVY